MGSHDAMTIDDFLRREIAVGSFPSAVYAFGSASGIAQSGALGNAVAVPLRLRANVDTIYDVASTTKPLITTTLILQAVAEGRIALDDRAYGFTYRELLTHTSGLQAWLPLYTYDDYLSAILTHGRTHESGTKVVYSDLNFILLWYALRELYGDYVAVARERIFTELGIDDEAMFNPPAILRPRIAATEWGQRWEVKMCADRHLPAHGLRDTLIWGETHDGNSFHAGGTAGNAGLFATVAAMFRLMQAIVRGELYSRELLAESTRNYTAGLEENRGLGWQLQSPASPATKMLSPRAFGHTGFTGTSIWCDPEQDDRIFVLLTNRVHPCAAPVAMQAIRGEYHRLASR
jgi:CubicO group peptidase (beta-lactamase class C family)